MPKTLKFNAPAIKSLSCSLPDTGFLREFQIIGDKEAEPPIPALIPISRAAWWLGVKNGRYPKAVKLGPRTTAWRVEDIRALIVDLSKGGGGDE